ncbi:TonB-dependent receptor [Sphingomonas ginkgonis]|uniref:TonB-dependent receptor n=1 Tax=Sphingomonas ginkgonis TaxID=2315330 RepID=A0A429VBC7_9SPHN|nr:TonB-dependent receptor [Sphingomonas ginkgonis]
MSRTIIRNGAHHHVPHEGESWNMKSVYRASAASIAILACAAPAWAEETAQTATQARSAPSPKAPDEIVVTAQRREENLQKVPVAVTAFDDKKRDQLGIRTIQDMSNVAPGLSFNAQLDRLSIRGVGRLTNTIGSDPGVAVYNDGFYTSSNAEASKTPMFVQSVQVLRGPQGTLFGRNSVGGAIMVISKRPADRFGGEVRLSGDAYNGLIAEGYVTGPITSGIKYRASVQFGPRPVKEAFHNIGPAGDQGSSKRFLLEGQLQWDFSPDVQLWLKYSHAEWDHERYGITNFVSPYATTPFFPAGALVPNAAYGYAVPNPGATDTRETNLNTTNEDTLKKNHNIVGNFRAALSDNVQLKYVAGYSQYVYDLFTDLDYTAAGKQTSNLGSRYGAFSFNPTYVQRYVEDKKYYSNEITLSNIGSNDRLNWVLGAYQYHEHYYQPISWYVGGDGTDSMATALTKPICLNAAFGLAATCAPNPERDFYRGTGDLRINSLAAFGQADYRFTDALKVTAGLRYSSDRKRGVETYRLVSYNPVGAAYCVFAPFGVIGFGNCGPLTAAQDITTYVLQIAGSGEQTRTLRKRFSGWSWRLGADWQLGRNTLAYVSYNRGLKAGGFNLGS